MINLKTMVMKNSMTMDSKIVNMKMMVMTELVIQLKNMDSKTMDSTMVFLKTMTMINFTTMDPKIVNTKTMMMKNLTIQLKKMALKTMDMKMTAIPHQTNDNQLGYYIGIPRTIVSKLETHHLRARYTLASVTMNLHQMTTLHYTEIYVKSE